jgi:hypothetical protein
MRVDIRYLNNDDNVECFRDAKNMKFGRVMFKHSLKKDILYSSQSSRPSDPDPADRKPRGFEVVDYRTFVRPGVDQVYTFVTSVPEACTYVLVWASFDHVQRQPNRLQGVVLALSRHLGLIQYDLKRAEIPQNAERVFKVRNSS